MQDVERKQSSSEKYEYMSEMAKTLRLNVLEMTSSYGGHLSSCFSAVEIITTLYFGDILRHRPNEPHWSERDRFILSKGHAAPLLYAVLAYSGYFPVENLKKFRQISSGLHGHPIQDSLAGVEMTSGSLGQGLSFGIGHVIAGKINNQRYKVYVLLGDGECEEGQIWESAMAASHFKIDNLIVIIDYNKYQQTGPINTEMNLEPFVEKWRSFNWHVEEIDGHDIKALHVKFMEFQDDQKQPTVIIAHTIKGKGVSFVENDYTFHGRTLTPEQVVIAREEILCK